jgi:hypothetical protein
VFLGSKGCSAGQGENTKVGKSLSDMPILCPIMVELGVSVEAPHGELLWYDIMRHIYEGWPCHIY